MFRLRTNARADARVSVAMVDENAQSFPACSGPSYYSMVRPRKRQASAKDIVPISITFRAELAPGGPAVQPPNLVMRACGSRLPSGWVGSTIAFRRRAGAQWDFPPARGAMQPCSLGWKNGSPVATLQTRCAADSRSARARRGFAGRLQAHAFHRLCGQPDFRFAGGALVDASHDATSTTRDHTSAD